MRSVWSDIRFFCWSKRKALNQINWNHLALFWLVLTTHSLHNSCPNPCLLFAANYVFTWFPSRRSHCDVRASIEFKSCKHGEYWWFSQLFRLCVDEIAPKGYPNQGTTVQESSVVVNKRDTSYNMNIMCAYKLILPVTQWVKLRKQFGVLGDCGFAFKCADDGLLNWQTQAVFKCQRAGSVASVRPLGTGVMWSCIVNYKSCLRLPQAHRA